MIHSENHAEIVIPQETFQPGDEINGIIRWNLKKPPKKINLTLFWKTSGRGDPDGDIIIEEKLPQKASGEKEFSFNIPNSPYSFKGKLISLHWKLRFKSISPTLTVNKDLIISPTGEEIKLGSVENQKLTKAFIEPA